MKRIIIDEQQPRDGIAAAAARVEQVRYLVCADVIDPGTGQWRQSRQVHVYAAYGAAAKKCRELSKRADHRDVHVALVPRNLEPIPVDTEIDLDRIGWYIEEAGDE